MRAEMLIKGGLVVDGTGAVPVAGDVLVRDGRIAAIGKVAALPDAITIDAAGLLVSPGFIDIHSHSDFTLMVDPRALSAITQGVTLEVIGNCGHGCAPVGDDPQVIKSNCYGYIEGEPIGWRSIGEYLSALQERRPAVNVIYLVPNGNLRLIAARALDRESTPDELAQMKRLLAEGMDEGAWGYSTGLEYAPERSCTEAEVTALCRVAAERGGFYATHTRNRMGEATQTIEEAIRTAHAADIPLQISHISSITRLTDAGRAALEQAMRMVDDACDAGCDAAFDMHTRLFGLTNLSAALPPSASQGSRAEIAEKLRSPSLRAEMRARQSIVTSLARGDWSRVVLYNCRSHPELARKSLVEISDSRGGGDVFDAICDILLDEIDDLHGPMILGYAYDEADMRMVFDHPNCMVGSDATALAPTGRLRDMFFHGAYTWAAWFFRHFVHEKKQMTVQEAVRRLTGLPAKRLGLSDRGVLRQGAFADIAIFDPALFSARGTTFEPNQLAVGMRHVIVNGELTLRDGALTGTRAGEVLRH